MLQRYLLRGSLLLLFLMAPVLVDPGSEAMAQACTRELADADQAYTFGRFDEAINVLDRCLDKSNATSSEQQQAYRLLALSYIGKDDSRGARRNVEALLRINPNYQPDADQDPPQFVEMVREAKRDIARAAQPREPEVEDEGGGGVSKWLLIGGGVALAAVAAVLLAGGGDDDNGDDGGPPQPTTLSEREPNDAPAQAQILRGNPPITVNGNAEVEDNSSVGRNFPDGSFDDFEDWYQFTISTPGVQITLRDLVSDCDLYLMEQGTLDFLGTSDNSGTQTESINNGGLAAGTYLIGISIFDADPQGPNSTPYTLVVNGSVSGSNLRVVTEEIRGFGGAEVADHLRLVAHDGVAELPAALPDATAWTAYHDDGGTLVEYDATETFRFRPGRGFWVQSAEPFSVKAAATPAPAASEDAMVVPLEAGWNIIANPSRSALDWAAVQAANGITQGLWRWDGHFVQTDTFEPARRGEAYYFLNATGLDRLAIPRWGGAARPSHRRTPSALTLSAYREGRLAAVVRAGFADDAAPGIDGYDQYAPPGYFETASLRLIRQFSSKSRVELASEFRPWGEAGQRFELALEAPAHAPIELRAEGLEVFAGYAVNLIDREKTAAYDLHAQPVLTLTSSQALSRFTLVVGDAAFAGAARAELAPEAISLSNYPNPFNPRTHISYTVPAAAAQEPVRLDVYDVAGHLVRVLVEGIQEPGVHQVEWDGTDASGVPVASGVYLYRLQTAGQVQVQRMLLMK